MVILTKNSEKKLKECLESVKWADEIIIVDGESRDNTLNIARAYTDKIFIRPFSGSFANERNFGESKSEGDWILQLDSDEVVEEDFRKKIMEVLEDGTPFYAFRFLRKNFFLGKFMKYGGWLHYSLHFYRRGFASYEGRIHETLKVKENNIGRVDVGVRHYPFDSLSEFIDRQNKYTTLEAQRFFDERGRLSIKFVKYQMFKKPLKLFIKIFFKKKGYREGIYGFIFSILFSFVHFLKWAKYWELYLRPPMGFKDV